ncbi:LysR family transcriptional regulator [Desertibacillus haloalkaliphilus]|uniref:LysR family transcriptional regulator n=1 Tax=Desertibacillus haloalkaliphilus TaxID=1328930 RepID=UPI001C280D1F|nr:LysR family transcriptional regulator [Desertibacillus haloalkaliphilus]MBU8908842.1 LysR family transcriptional regulator [Desertibacillus haloalkaliphilus]
MDIRQLEYFSAVASHLSFTKASKTLHVSQPSISKAIKNLEDELGVPLFYRSPKRLELTDAGKAVLVNAKHVLEAFEQLTTELTDVIELKKGEINIGIPPIVGATFFSQVVKYFKEQYPHINIKLTEVGTKKIKEGVENGSLDIGLICSIPKTNQSFETLKLSKDPLQLVVYKDHHLASQTKIHFSTLATESFILYREDFSLHDTIIEQCLQNGFQPQIICESSQRDFMIEMVAAKLGIALLPSKVCEQITNKHIRVIPLSDTDLHLELGLVWRKDKYLPFAARQLIDTAHHLILTKEQI